MEERNFNLAYIRKLLNEISKAVNYAKELTPEEKIEFKQQLTNPIVYCIDKDFKVAREGWHVITK